MFASLIQTTWLLFAQASNIVRVEDDADSAWFEVIGLVVVMGLVWLLVRPAPIEAKTPQSRRPSRVPLTNAARSAPATDRIASASEPHSARSDYVRSAARSELRVIRLHAVTPGQSEYEYNVGDPSGTRGSALVRVA